MDAQRVFFNIPVSLIVDQSGKLHSSQVEWRIPRTRSGIYDSKQPCDQLPSPNSPGFPLLSSCFLGQTRVNRAKDKARARAASAVIVCEVTCQETRTDRRRTVILNAAFH